MRYAADSVGNVVEITALPTAIAKDSKIAELVSYEKYLKLSLEQNGINSAVKMFYMFEESLRYEYLCFFTKTEVTAKETIKIVKELEEHVTNYNRKYIDFYQSIFSEMINGKTKWYYLKVGRIQFERNMYDLSKINSRYIKPISVSKFLKILPDFDCTYSFENPDITAMLKSALEQDTLFEENVYVLDKLIEVIVDNYNKKMYATKDKESNIANEYFNIISTKKNIFPEYKNLKTFIKKKFSNAYGICYHGNKIQATINENKIIIYVSFSGEIPIFIIGGKSYTFKEFTDALTSGNSFIETEWYVNKIKPILN